MKAEKNTPITASDPIINEVTDIQFKASLFQDGDHPGITIELSATLKEFGVPIDHRATVTAHVNRPDGAKESISFQEKTPGHFKSSYANTLAAGVYTFHVHAEGKTATNIPFTAKQTLTGQVYYGDVKPDPKAK